MAGNMDRNAKALQEAWRREENTFCADCEKPDPDWASYTLGVFLCLDCAEIHRNIPGISKVKSIRMDCWEEGQIELPESLYQQGLETMVYLHCRMITDWQHFNCNGSIFLMQHGNAKAKAKYEAHVPFYYYHPVHTDCLLLREQWIRAKYERKEFMKPGKQSPYSNDSSSGLQRSDEEQSFFSRFFFILQLPEASASMVNEAVVMSKISCEPKIENQEKNAKYLIK